MWISPKNLTCLSRCDSENLAPCLDRQCPYGVDYWVPPEFS